MLPPLRPPPPASATAQVTQLLAEASQRIQPTVGELFQALKVRLWLLGLGLGALRWAWGAQ